MEQQALKTQQDAPSNFAHFLQLADLNFCPQCRLTHHKDEFRTVLIVIQERKKGSEEDPEDSRFVRKSHLYDYCERCADFTLGQSGPQRDYALQNKQTVFAFEVHKDDGRYLAYHFGANKEIDLEHVHDHRFPVFSGVAIPHHLLEKSNLL